MIGDLMAQFWIREDGPWIHVALTKAKARTCWGIT